MKYVCFYSMLVAIAGSASIIPAQDAAPRNPDPTEPPFVRHNAQFDYAVLTELKKAWPRYQTVHQDRMAVITYDSWKKDKSGNIVPEVKTKKVYYEVTQRAPFLASGPRYVEFPMLKIISPDEAWVTTSSSSTSTTPDESLKNAVDGNPDTIWHTAYDPSGRSTDKERWFQVNLPSEYAETRTVVGFVYLGRKNSLNGLMKTFQCFAWTGDSKEPPAKSDVKTVWPQSVLEHTTNKQVVLFGTFDPAKPDRGEKWAERWNHVRVQCLDDYSGGQFFSIAEFQLLLVENAALRDEQQAANQSARP